MSPAELAQRLAALDWSTTSLQHQLAVSCAVTTLLGPTQAELDRAFPIAPLTGTPADKLAMSSAYGASNVVPLRTRNRWTTLHQLDGRPWASSFDFGPDGAWAWVVETVATEWGCGEDVVGSLEGTEGVWDGDDLVTIDGLPVYRLRTAWR